jgi:very-short-patch-repair endonuclease
VDPTDALAQLGGAGRVEQVLQMTSRRQLRTAIRHGAVVRVSHGAVALGSTRTAAADAARLTAVVSHLTAALEHGWEVARPPQRPQLIVKRKRRLTPQQRRGVEIRHRDLEHHEVHGWTTSPHRTVIDCARDLPFADAVAVADSALRHGHVDAGELRKRAAALSTTGRRGAMRVVEAATPLAANPFESVLRAIALDVPDLHVEPQVVIDERGFRCRPDLVDVERRLVVEADSFEFHGHRQALHRDCERYNALVVRGWTVLRFSWEHVMLHPDYVREVLVSALVGPSQQAPRPTRLDLPA